MPRSTFICDKHSLRNGNQNWQEIYGLISNGQQAPLFMAPNFHDTLHNRYSTSSDGYASSDSGSTNSSFIYNDSVTEMDRQLARIRKAPSKIIDEKRRFIILIDMSNFKPEDIEVFLEKGRLTVKGYQEVMIDAKTSIEKHFVRKFSIPDDVRDEFVATELDKFGMLKITLLRKLP